MDFTRLQRETVAAYEYVSSWVYYNPGWTDILIVLGVVGSLFFLLRRKARIRRRAHRMLWGVRMRRSRNRLAYEKSNLANAIEDHLFEEVWHGNMTQKSADEWRHSFANHYQMDELLPRKDRVSEKKNRWFTKKAISGRLRRGIHKIKPLIPGGKPSVKIDTSYQPVVEEAGMEKSKYANTAS